MAITREFKNFGKEVEDKTSIIYWIRDLNENSKLSEIINTPAFQRLYDISFLGAIDYSDCSKLVKIERSRAYHSICVAGLANYISIERNYSKELKENLIAAALIHDIGHMPLSHSAEPYIKSHLGYGHHELGESIIDGKVKSDKKLHDILKNKFDIGFLKELLSNKLSSDGGDLFSNQINIDTIDGITRCLEYKGVNKSNSLNRLAIAKAAFVSGDENKYRLTHLDDFWKAKHFVYCNYINNKHGVISDTLSQIFFEEKNDIDESDLLSNEKKWMKKYGVLFEWFRDLKNKRIPACMANYNINITARKYEILYEEMDIRNRYVNKKSKSVIKIDNLADSKLIQLDFDM
ncbi:HD domain [Serratia fonticola]|uniref:HD domain-containing protein n=1 Tax=Serratia fonticola TaxID=47917 RepID=UPI002182866B|nr:HD domain-containing protein [Serratia fonticola]CAI2431104.1 HD domain [Serratia fonticola]